MALPQLFSINAFDSTTEHIFKFTYEGNQVRKNRLVIYNNGTDDIVYDKTVESLQLHHTVPANTLTNGILYAVAVECFDKNNVSSGLSNKVIFYCFDTPVFGFSNITPGMTIINSAYQATLTYSQPQNEELNSYQFYLYDNNKTEIYKSGLKYDTDNMYINYTNLEESSYYARAIGQTLNGMSVDTGYIPFVVEYESMSVFSILEATNEYDKGRIKLSVNVIALEAQSEGSVIYIDNSMADFRENGSKAVFNKGFKIVNDFTMQVILAKNPVYNKDFIIFEDINGNSISLSWEKGTFECNNNTEKSYVKLSVKSATTCTIFSNYADNPTENQKTMVWLRKTNNDYSIKIQNLQEV